MKFRTLLSTGVIVCASGVSLPAVGLAAEVGVDGAIEPDSRPGKAIVVTATRSELELEDAPASISVITGC